MGRKAKYTTDEERREAKAKYDADYYSKNRRSILKKRKKAYTEKLEEKELDESDNVGRGRTMSTQSEALELQRSFKIIRGQLKRLDRLVGRSLREYASGLCDEALLRPTSAISILEGALSGVNNVAEPAKAACNRIWELTGASSEHTKAVGMIDRFRQALDVVGDVFNEATNDLDNLSSLRRAMERETLAYFRL